MKKVFISVPMKDRTPKAIEESIFKMQKATEALLGENVEVLPTYQKHIEIGSDKEALKALGEAVVLMAEADYFVCPEQTWRFRGVSLEEDIAAGYHIPIVSLPLDFVCPDVIEAEKKRLQEEIGETLTPVKLTPVNEVAK